jgi:hypothetical protein
MTMSRWMDLPFLCAIAVGAWAQQPVPPEKATPASLVHETTQRRQAWTSYEPGLLANLFSGDPAQVEEKLKKAASLMNAYKDSEILVYTSLSKMIDEDIAKLRTAGNDAEWKRYIQERPKIVNGQLSALRDQDVNLEQEIAKLAGRNDSQSKSLVSSLSRSLADLREFQRQLSAYRTDLERDNVLETATTQAAALRSLKAQQAVLQALRKNTVDSKEQLGAVYKNSQFAVRAHAAQAQTANEGGRKPAAPVESGRRSPGTSVTAAPKQGMTGAWSSTSQRFDADGSPYYVTLSIEKVVPAGESAILTGRVHVLFDPVPQRDIEFECTCTPNGSRLSCAGGSREWEGYAFLNTDSRIGPDMPDVLHLTFAGAQRISSISPKEEWKLRGELDLQRSPGNRAVRRPGAHPLSGPAPTHPLPPENSQDSSQCPRD